jgi:hydroxyacylglutathione hydrolase
MAKTPTRAPTSAHSFHRLVIAPPRLVAERLWLVRASLFRRSINVFLIEEADGVTAFDAGARGMGGSLAALAGPLGGIARVVLSHSHPDHRGGAPAIGAPTLCHHAERSDLEGDGGKRYFSYRNGETKIDRIRMSLLMRLADSGPVAVADTLAEGDEVGGFTVLHLPGHAPGLIALWRPQDRVVLASDVFTTQGTKPVGTPELPKPAYSQDPDRARASLLELAALGPATAWPAHGEPLIGDVRHALEVAARA